MHEAGDTENQRQIAIDRKESALQQGNLTLFSVYLGGADDQDAIRSIRELASGGMDNFPVANAEDFQNITNVFKNFARRLKFARSNYVIGVCTPVEQTKRL